MPKVTIWQSFVFSHFCAATSPASAFVITVNVPPAGHHRIGGRKRHGGIRNWLRAGYLRRGARKQPQRAKLFFAMRNFPQGRRQFPPLKNTLTGTGDVTVTNNNSNVLNLTVTALPGAPTAVTATAGNGQATGRSPLRQATVARRL